MFAKDYKPNPMLWALGIALAPMVIMLLTAELGSLFLFLLGNEVNHLDSGFQTDTAGFPEQLTC